MAELFNSTHEVMVVLPSGFILPTTDPTVVRGYQAVHIASNKKTGEKLFYAFADTQSDIEKFLLDYGNPSEVEITNRKDWQLNMYASEDDGVTDFRELVIKGMAKAEEIDSARQFKADAEKRAAEADLQRQEEVKKINEEFMRRREEVTR